MCLPSATENEKDEDQVTPSLARSLSRDTESNEPRMLKERTKKQRTPNSMLTSKISTDLPPVKPSAIALGTIFNHTAELAGMQLPQVTPPTPNIGIR